MSDLERILSSYLSAYTRTSDDQIRHEILGKVMAIVEREKDVSYRDGIQSHRGIVNAVGGYKEGFKDSAEAANGRKLL